MSSGSAPPKTRRRSTTSASQASRGDAIAKPTVNLTQTLAARPTRNAAVREETRGDALVLFVPLRKRWWMAGPVSWCLPLRSERGVALDRLGQEVWRACDGQRPLEAIVEAFADRHRLGFHEARLTVMRFLRMLAQRKLLVLVGSAEEIPIEAKEDAGAQTQAMSSDLTAAEAVTP